MLALPFVWQRPNWTVSLTHYRDLGNYGKYSQVWNRTVPASVATRRMTGWIIVIPRGQVHRFKLQARNDRRNASICNGLGSFRRQDDEDGYQSCPKVAARWRQFGGRYPSINHRGTVGSAESIVTIGHALRCFTLNTRAVLQYADNCQVSAAAIPAKCSNWEMRDPL